MPTPIEILTIEQFAARTGADVRVLPHNVALLGQQRAVPTWLVYRHDSVGPLGRLGPLINHLGRALPERSDRWLLACLSDGWRERVPSAADPQWVLPTADLANQPEWRGPAGSIPRLSHLQPWVGCFAGRRSDPSAVLLPEAHWLRENGYRRLLTMTRLERRPWSRRANRAVYAGGDHGEAEQALDGRTKRQLLRDLTVDHSWPIDVSLGTRVSRRRQLGYKYLVDLDGYVRTFDGWAWKMSSGSVVLSPDSDWETVFTRAFTPWEHFVPVAADLADLPDRIEWCVSNDNECKEMARRAAARARVVYSRSAVEAATRDALTAAWGGSASG